VKYAKILLNFGEICGTIKKRGQKSAFDLDKKRFYL